MKKTITLEDKSGNPGVVICRGHVTAKEFNEAYKNEWSSKGLYKQADLSYEYWIIGKERAKRSVPGKLGSKKVTVAQWD